MKKHTTSFLVLQPGPGVVRWQSQLAVDVGRLEREYDVLLNGNGGQTDEQFPFFVKGALFMSQEFSNLFFVVSALLGGQGPQELPFWCPLAFIKPLLM